MKRALFVMFAGAFCLVHGVSARADDKAEITALFQKLSAATKAKSADAYLALVTPDYKEIRINGDEIQGKQAEQAIRARFAQMKSVSVAKVVPGEMRITASTAFMWSEFSISAEIVDKDGLYGTKGQKHLFADTGKTRYWLIKTPKGWRFQKSEVLKENPTVDGQSTHRMGPKR